MHRANSVHTDSPDWRELYCTWHTALWGKWADHQPKEEQQQFKDLNPFGWESCLLLAKLKETSVSKVIDIFGWQKSLLKSLQAMDTKSSHKKIPFSCTNATSVHALQFRMKFSIHPRAALVAHRLVAQIGRGDLPLKFLSHYSSSSRIGEIF